MTTPTLAALSIETLIQQPNSYFQRDTQILKKVSEMLASKILTCASLNTRESFPEKDKEYLTCVIDYLGGSPLNSISLKALIFWSYKYKKIYVPSESDFKDITFKSFEKLEILHITYPKNLNKDQLLQLCDCLPTTLIDFKLTGCLAMDDEVLEKLCTKCPHLKCIDLSYGMTNQGLKTLADKCGQTITHLRLKDISTFTEFPPNFIALIEVDLSGTNINNEGLKNLEASSGTLKILKLWNANKFTRLPNLRVLEEIDLGATEIDNEGLSEFGDCCGGTLIFLNLSWARKFTTLPVTLVALVKISLRFTRISNEELKKLGEISGKTLEVLELELVDNFINLTCDFIALKELDLRFINISNRELEKLGGYCGRTMEVLILEQAKNFSQLPPTFIALKMIDLSGTNINNEGLELLGKYCGRTLKQVILKGAKNFTKFPKTLFSALEMVDFTDTNIVTEIGVESLN